MTRFLLLLILTMSFYSCKKEHTGVNYIDPFSLKDPRLKQVDLFIIPIINGQPVPKDKYVYQSHTYDNKNNLIIARRRLNSNLDTTINPLFISEYKYNDKERIEATFSYTSLYKERVRYLNGYDAERWVYNINGLIERHTYEYRQDTLVKKEMYVFVDNKEYHYSTGTLIGSSFEFNLRVSDPYIWQTVTENSKLRIHPQTYFPNIPKIMGASFPITKKNKDGTPAKGEYYINRDNVYEKELVGLTEYIYYR